MWGWVPRLTESMEGSKALSARCLPCAVSHMACDVWCTAATDQATTHLLQAHPQQKHHPLALAQLASAGWTHLFEH